MRRLGLMGLLALAIAAIAAIPALAVPPTSVTQTGGLHFCPDVAGNPDVSADKTDGAFLTATGEICGAGRTATATLDADVTAVVGCVTRGGGEPRGLEEAAATVTVSEPIRTRQGRGTFDLSTDPITIEDFPEFDCPSAQQREVLVGPVTFSDITLTIESQTGTLTATFPDLDP